MSLPSLDARLLRALRAARVHVPLSDLAAELGATQDEIAAAMQRLDGAGFDIEEKPGLGCRLLVSPDRLIADDLTARIGECELAREILTFHETASTNDVAARMGRDGHPGALVVFAETQTAGRGRFGRRWESAPRAGLWFSLLLRPAFAMAKWARLTTWAGVCVATAVERCTGIETRIKWPNDIMVGGKKAGGILTESASDAGRGAFAIVGIGLNINQEAMPAELADRATSLRQSCGRLLDRGAIAADIIREMAARLPEVGESFAAILADATRRSSVLGKWIRLASANTIFEGTAESLDPEGGLVLCLSDGRMQTMTGGEVTTQSDVS